MMNRLVRSAMLALFTAAMLASSERVLAQANGNQGTNQNGGRNRAPRDPAQMLERRMQRYRDQLEVASDDEWKAIQPLIEKVIAAQRETRIGGFGFGGRGGRGGQRNGGQAEDGAANGGRGNRGGRFGGGDPNPNTVALQRAVESKASTAEIKAELARVRETLKQKEADLAMAQENLRQVLTARQEAIGLLLGLLR